MGLQMTGISTPTSVSKTVNVLAYYLGSPRIKTMWYDQLPKVHLPICFFSLLFSTESNHLWCKQAPFLKQGREQSPMHSPPCHMTKSKAPCPAFFPLISEKASHAPHQRLHPNIEPIQGPGPISGWQLPTSLLPTRASDGP